MGAYEPNDIAHHLSLLLADRVFSKAGSRPLRLDSPLPFPSPKGARASKIDHEIHEIQGIATLREISKSGPGEGEEGKGKEDRDSFSWRVSRTSKKL